MSKIPLARPTVYKGVQMRSRLEAGFAAWLDQQGFEWEYEPQAFASDRGQYLPDFLLHNLPILLPPYNDHPAKLGKVHAPFVEVKPPGYDPVEVFARMSIIHDTDPAASLFIASPEHPHGLRGSVDLEPLVGIVPERGWPCVAISVPTRLPWPDGYWNGPS